MIMRGFSNLQNRILKQSQTVKDYSNQRVEDFDASSSFVQINLEEDMAKKGKMFDLNV